MSDTPRTQELRMKWDGIAPHKQQIVELYSKCEELERELTTMKFQRDLMKQELQNIASASPMKWQMTTSDFNFEFKIWAQNRANLAIKSTKERIHQ